RRHPFIYASAIPFGLCFYLSFSPPEGLSQIQLFSWMLIWSSLTRCFMTLYHVPHLALGAELSNDYAERTRVFAFSSFFGFFGAALMFVLAYSVFFTKSAEFPNNPQLDPSGYEPMALVFSTIIVVFIFISGIGTHSRIPYLNVSDSHASFSFKRLLEELKEALNNPHFKNLFIGILFFFISRGVEGSLSIYMGTFFWKLGDKALVVPMVLLFGVMMGVPIWASFSNKVQKKTMFLSGLIVFGLLSTGTPLLKIVGFFPDNSSDFYLPTIMILTLISALAVAGPVVANGAMLADIADQHELKTGRRQEGIFFGAMAFSSKASHGLGAGISSLGLWAISFPTQIKEVSVIDDNTITYLGILAGPSTLIIMLIALIYLNRYNLTKEIHADIKLQLAEKRSPTTQPRES
ncbi:MAG: MFS transporter, partial [Pseudomonadales bacterium]|nr:MFS transporter [Pseudomonadales bacterium]